MTGLPLVWGEKGPFDPAARPAAAYVELSREFDFRLVDVLDAETLERGRLLFLAQPQRARSGGAGRARRLDPPGADGRSSSPIRSWPGRANSRWATSGGRRRSGLLAPLLGHWGMILEAPARPGEVRGALGRSADPCSTRPAASEARARTARSTRRAGRPSAGSAAEW